MYMSLPRNNLRKILLQDFLTSLQGEVPQPFVERFAMNGLESLTDKTKQIANTYKTQLPNPFVEPPHGTADLDGYLAA